jgi:16S rRNA (cytosine1402-N4)-methyltransferase
MQSSYHNTVLLKKSVEGLNIKPEGIYADVTFGGGGHSKEILKYLKTGKLIAFDQDSDAEIKAYQLIKSEASGNKLVFYRANFKYISNFLKYEGFSKIDGIIADLGVSSRQFDEVERGFSFRLGGKPDMRMNKNAKLSSYDILNRYSEEKIADILEQYGEIRSARKLANVIVKSREIKSLEQLNEIVRNTINTKKDFKILAQVYQALRIETNNEIENLKSLMLQSSKLLKKTGRLVIISYHSLEDRIVKNYIKYADFLGQSTTDVYGKSKIEFKETGKLVVPDEFEIETNNRARSAKLRIAEKL